MRNLVLIFLFAGSAVVPLAGCETMATFDQSPTATVDDGTLTARVKDAIANEAGPSIAMNVNVASSAGTVQLTGFVESEQTSLRAEQVARSIEGVRAVRNDLNVTRPRQLIGPGLSPTQ